MTYTRAALTTLLPALMLALTACGGGGDTGPQWAQEVKQSTAALQTGSTAQVFKGSVCSDLGDSIGQETEIYTRRYYVISATTNPLQYTRVARADIYSDATCADASRELSITYPEELVTIDGTTNLASGREVQRLTIYSPAGAISVTTLKATVSETPGTYILSNGREVPLLADGSEVTASQEVQIQAATSTTLRYGDTEGLSADDYPTVLQFELFTLDTQVPPGSLN